MESVRANKLTLKNRSQQEKLRTRSDELVDNVKRGAYVWKEDKCIYAKTVAEHRNFWWTNIKQAGFHLEEALTDWFHRFLFGTSRTSACLKHSYSNKALKSRHGSVFDCQIFNTSHEKELLSMVVEMLI